MADIALATGVTELSLVGNHHHIEYGHIPCLVDVTLPVCAICIDATTGKWTLADASTGATNRVFGISRRTQKAGYGLTVLRYGVIDGLDLSGLAYDAPVYLSN